MNDCGLPREPGAGSLSGRRILVTRAADQADEMLKALAEKGAVPLACPTIAIVPPEDFSELDAALNNLGRFDFLVLTSVNAVRSFFGRFRESGRECCDLAALCLVAVGPKTAEALDDQGLKADLVPEDYRAEGVVELLKDRVAGKRVLYPKAALARDLIVSQLSAAGAEVIAPVAYGSAPPPGAAERLREALDAGLDLLTFTASSTVRNLVALLDKQNLARARSVPVASIGPLTSETCRKLGFQVVIEPQDSTLPAMLDAIDAYYSRGAV